MTNQPSKGWLEVGIKFGVPAMIAIYLVYVLTGEVRTVVRDTQGLVREHISESHEQTDVLRRMLLINQEQCINSAVTSKRNPKECLK